MAVLYFANILSNLSRSLFIFAVNTGGHSYATHNEEKGSFTSVTWV